MNVQILLASGSQIRAQMFRNAGVKIEQVPARIDEESIKSSLVAEGVKPRDICDALATAKARKISSKHPNAWIVGSDQVLEIDGLMLSKPKTVEDARLQLKSLSGAKHDLYSSCVIYLDGEPQWRFIGKAEMNVRHLSDTFIDDYVERNWNDIQYCVGCYQIEGEGVRLFESVRGDHFHVMGFPLIETLNYLTRRGVLQE